ncbi:putative cytochrome P450 superfamily [Helianthus annuus]|nr:putative cytochrome P450 superfamily [Helianthus annuus]
MSFQIGKTIIRQKKPHFPSPPLPLLSGSLEHSISVGRRGCPGTNLGYRIIGLALGTLIQLFDWERIGAEEVGMTAYYGLSMAKLKALQAACKPRSNMITHIL